MILSYLIVDKYKWNFWVDSSTSCSDRHRRMFIPMIGQICLQDAKYRKTWFDIALSVGWVSTNKEVFPKIQITKKNWVVCSVIVRDLDGASCCSSPPAGFHAQSCTYAWAGRQWEGNEGLKTWLVERLGRRIFNWIRPVSLRWFSAYALHHNHLWHGARKLQQPLCFFSSTAQLKTGLGSSI